MKWINLDDRVPTMEGLYLFSYDPNSISLAVLTFEDGENLFVRIFDETDFNRNLLPMNATEFYRVMNIKEFIYIPWSNTFIAAKNSLNHGRSISSRKRLKVFRKYNFSCNYCGNNRSVDSDCRLHLDHVVPVSKGGSNNFGNLQILCSLCNYDKSDAII